MKKYLTESPTIHFDSNEGPVIVLVFQSKMDFNLLGPDTPIMNQPMPHFADRLVEAIQEKKTPLCVGLDPRADHLPPIWRNEIPIGTTKDVFAHIAAIYIEYCREIIDIVGPLVPCVKPQSAFFEAIGPAGSTALAEVIQYAQKSGLLVVLDAKRGDIGSTATAYAEAYLGQFPLSPWGCDCLTVNPYLGADTLEPFVDSATRHDSGLFVLVKTSNPGSQTIQDLAADGRPVFEHVAELVQNLALQTVGEYGYGAVGAVIGATYPEQLSELRKSMPNTFFLVPGLGAQGGTAADIAGGFDENGLGALINSSRAIIFAYENPKYEHFGDDWKAAVHAATRDTIEQIATGTHAGKLVTDGKG